MEFLGSIVRLQIQQAGLKVGPVQQRWYDPAPVRAVESILLSESGVTCRNEDGSVTIDVHNLEHPQSKNSDGVNGVSLLFTEHYRTMRARFGEHLADGIAGESILVETNRMVSEEDLRDGVTIATGDGGELRLQDIIVAEPCVEFTRYALRYPHTARSDRTVTDALEFLRAGMRGFYASYIGAPGTVRVSDRVFLSEEG